MLSFISALLVILIAALWSFQGFFSAVIMFGEVLISLMIAFSCYEPLAASFQGSVSPELGEPGLLVVLFFVSLGIMRFITDKYIPGNINMNLAVDRAGGAIFGLFSGLVMVGVCLIAAQMLPLGHSTFGFERFSTTKDGRVIRNGIWLGPDTFTAGLANMLSSNRFVWGDASLERVQPSFLDALHYRRAAPQAESRVVLPQDAVAVSTIYRTDEVYKLELEQVDSKTVRKSPLARAERDVSNTWMVASLAIRKTAHEPDKDFVQFTPGQFRLVGPRPAEGARSTRPPKVYPAAGMSDIYIPPPFDVGRGGETKTVSRQQASVLVTMQLDTPLALTEGRHGALLDNNAYKVDVVFEVPSDFEPWYVEFKDGVRVETPKVEQTIRTGAGGGEKKTPTGAQRDSRRADADASGESAKEETTGDKEAESDRDKVQVGEAPKGRTHIFDAVQERTGVFDDFPAPIPVASVSRNMRGGGFWEGHVVVEIPEDPVEGQVVQKFNVPSGKKMVQVGVHRVYTASTLGNAMSYARSVANQYFLATADGQMYFPIGVYTIAVADGKLQLEVQYHPESEQPERALETPIKMNRWVIGRQDFKCGYIYLVDPGTKIVKFHQSSQTNQDLPIDVPNE